jgi:hypothetical protein
MVDERTRRERTEDRTRIVLGISIIILAVVVAYYAHMTIRHDALISAPMPVFDEPQATPEVSMPNATSSQGT